VPVLHSVYRTHAFSLYFFEICLESHLFSWNCRKFTLYYGVIIMKVAFRIIKLMMAIGFIALFATSFSPDKGYREHVNTWYKISTDELNPGILLHLDMSRGYSVADRDYIYIVVLDKDSMEYTVVFPNGGLWTAPAGDDFLLEMEEEFDNLEEYLKKKGSNPIEKRY
jgi:hypothetical protein